MNTVTAKIALDEQTLFYSMGLHIILQIPCKTSVREKCRNCARKNCGLFSLQISTLSTCPICCIFYTNHCTSNPTSVKDLKRSLSSWCMG